MCSKLFRLLPIIATMVLLAGCFSIKQPIITLSNADKLSAGAGTYFSISEESGERMTLTVHPQNPDTGSYKITGQDKDGEFEAHVHFKHVEKNIYLLQFFDTEDATMSVFIARIKSDSVEVFSIDSAKFKSILKAAQIPVVAKGNLNEIAKLRATDQTYGVNYFGLTLYGDDKKILDIALTLARKIELASDSKGQLFKREN